ncbi:hypothetical protein BH23GEM2_BH23GEM2_05790 [soil metagenome]
MRRRLGVIGSFVWDVIHRSGPQDTPVEEWGGITYALGGLDAALPDDWEIVPLVKVGYDLAPQAREYLTTLRRIAPDAAPIEVPHPNNRVVLRYTSEERRCEQLTGGVPPWQWLGLKPLLRDLDALYVNLISGFELDLETAQLIRRHFGGPLYCDLHSLLLGITPEGMRVPQPLATGAEWCRCFDFMQVNEEEMAMVAEDSLVFAARAVHEGLRTLVVTLGSRGVVYFAAPGFERITDLKRSTLSTAVGPIRTELLPARKNLTEIADPTGCGDVWGATYFSRLLAGDDVSRAMQVAMSAAARNVEHRGATGLAQFLRGELTTA